MENSTAGIIFMYLFYGTLALIVLTAFLTSLLWVINDAQECGKSPLWVGLMVALFYWPASLLIWMALRPQRKSHSSATTRRS